MATHRGRQGCATLSLLPVVWNPSRVWVRQSGMRFRVTVGCAVVMLVGATGCASRTVVSVTGSNGPVSVQVSTPPGVVAARCRRRRVVAAAV